MKFIFISLIIIVIVIYMNTKSYKNTRRHLTDEYGLGHFSKIDSGNYFQPVQTIPASWYVNLNV